MSILEKKIQDIWRFKDPHNLKYPTEKNSNMLEQIILQSSNKDSYVLDCFAGSGSTLKSAQKLGRKWIGVDSSSVAINIIKNAKIGNYKFVNLINISQEDIFNKSYKQMSLKLFVVSEDNDDYNL